MINRFPQITLVYNRYKKASSSRKAVVEIRITCNRKQKYISTGIFLYPKQWKGEKVINTPDALQLNEYIQKKVSDIRKVIIDMLEQDSLSIFLIPQKLDCLSNKPSFTDFCKQRSEIRKYGKSKDTQQRYDRFLEKFASWRGTITFEEVNDNMIISYDTYLSKQGMKDNSKWYNYHRFLNSFIEDAICEGWLHRNPYKWVNIDKGKNSRGIEKFISLTEFRALSKAHMPTECLERIRDLFIFQIYTCLSYADLKEFDASRIIDTGDMKIYTGKRHKTGKDFTIPLLPPALSILYKYNKRLPIISNEKYNEHLKVVAQAAGINKPLSSHWARHTGATMLLNEGIDMKIVAKICGHSSTRITEQVYAKLLDETVIEAVASINKKLKEKH